MISGIIGAAIAGAFSFITADRQISAQSQDSAHQFLRTQQQALYSKFLTQYDAAYEDIYQLDNILPHEQTSDEMYQTAYEKALSDSSALTPMVRELSLIASSEVAGNSEQLASKQLFLIGSLNLRPVEDQGKAKAAVEGDKALFDELNDLRKSFINSARKDLGSDL